jgi:hypothetical protein
VGVLIYFIHHLARSIQIDTIMSQIQRETREVVDDVYPDASGDPEPEERCPDPPTWAVVLPAAASGYIQAIEPAPLVEVAWRHDLVVRLARRVGDHVAGTPIAWAWRRSSDQPPPASALLEEACASWLADGWAIGSAVIVRRRCQWPSPCRISPSTWCAARRRYGGSGRRSRP